MADLQALSRTPGVPIAAAVSALACGVIYGLLGDVGYNLGDEGFLWYGVQRVLVGEVPIRDFQAYDPGRYYWCAAWSPVFGDGILGVRAGVSLFKALGIFCGLLVARRALDHPGWLFLVGIVLALWVFPRHKGFEPALALIAIWFATRLLEAPGARNVALYGVCVGVMGFFGRNHLAYNVAAGAAALGLVVLRGSALGPWRVCGLWAAGVGVGLLPTLGMLVFVPGYAASSWEFVGDLLQKGSNVPFELVWPWAVELEGRGWVEGSGTLGTSLAFLALFLVYPIALFCLWRTRSVRSPAHAALAASVLVGIPYVHHATVRSDVFHLAQAIHPLWLVLFCGPSLLGERHRRTARWAVAVGAVVLTAMVVPWGDVRVASWLGVGVAPLVPYDAQGETLRIPADGARYLRTLEAVVEERVGPSDGFFGAPDLVGLYALQRRPSPTWGLYFLFPESERRQRATIEALKARRVQWAMVVDRGLGRERHLSSTNPLVWRFFRARFAPVRDARLPEGHLLLRRSRAEGAGAASPGDS